MVLDNPDQRFVNKRKDLLETYVQTVIQISTAFNKMLPSSAQHSEYFWSINETNLMQEFLNCSTSTIKTPHVSKILLKSRIK